MEKIILDTNFLFLPFVHKIDIFAEMETRYGSFKPIVLSTTVEELKMLEERESNKIRKQIGLALELVKKCNVIAVKKKNEETFDDVIIRMAKRWDCIVATNDKLLKKRLRYHGISIIYMRQKKRLETEGYIK